MALFIFTPFETSRGTLCWLVSAHAHMCCPMIRRCPRHARVTIPASGLAHQHGQTQGPVETFSLFQNFVTDWRESLVQKHLSKIWGLSLRGGSGQSKTVTALAEHGAMPHREAGGGFVSNCLHLGADAESELLSLRAIAGSRDCGAHAGASTWQGIR